MKTNSFIVVDYNSTEIGIELIENPKEDYPRCAGIRGI